MEALNGNVHATTGYIQLSRCLCLTHTNPYCTYMTVLKVCRMRLVWWISLFALMNTLIALETRMVHLYCYLTTAKKKKKRNVIKTVVQNSPDISNLIK